LEAPTIYTEELNQNRHRRRLELSLDRQRVDRAFDFAEASVALITEHEDELDFPFPSIVCLGALRNIATELQIDLVGVQEIFQISLFGEDVDTRILRHNTISFLA
jgi:hypothetical protein